MGVPFTTEEYIDSSYIEEKYIASHYGDKVYEFNIIEKKIYLNEGVVSYHPVDDIYKEMRFFRRTDISNRILDPMIEAQGNVFKGTDDQGIDHYTARLAIFKDGWVIVPHNNGGVPYILKVTGEQITDDGQSGSALIDVSDNILKISVDYAPPDTELVVIGGSTVPTAVEVAVAVWNDTDSHTEGTKGALLEHTRHNRFNVFIDLEYVPEVDETPDGSQQYPFNTIADGIDYAELHRIYDLVVNSDTDLIIDRNLKNFTVTGIGTPRIVCNGNNLDGTEFNHVTLTGTYTGTIVAQDTNLAGLVTLDGFFEKCAMSGDFVVPDGAIASIVGCFTIETDLTPSDFTLGVGSSLVMTSYDGGVQFSNITDINSIVKCIRHAGNIGINASCIAGTFKGGGIGSITDLGTMDSVTDRMINPVEVKDIHIAEVGHRKSVGLVDTHYNDDDTERNIFDITEDGNGIVTEVTPR